MQYRDSCSCSCASPGDPGTAESGAALLAWQMSDHCPPLSPRERHFYADDSLVEERETKADEIQSHLQSDCDNLQRAKEK